MATDHTNDGDGIETGIEYESDAPTTANVFAYADDGEYATVWALTRVADDVITVLTFRAEAGLYVSDGEMFTVSPDADQSTEEFAREFASRDPEEAVRLAREMRERPEGGF